jgi:hypothetical protein
MVIHFSSLLNAWKITHFAPKRNQILPKSPLTDRKLPLTCCDTRNNIRIMEEGIYSSAAGRFLSFLLICV